MTGRVLPFDASAHTAADALLPFYVNATLRGEELAFVEKHLSACERCRSEVEWLRTIFASLAANTAGADTSGAATESPQGVETRESAHAWSGRVHDRLAASNRWTRWLLAAQLAAIAVLGTILATNISDVASYRTLGAVSPSAHVRDAVAVKFDPAATESDIRRIVRDAGGRIVDGPTSVDAYLLEIPADRIDSALEALHQEHAVRFAERLAPRAER
jgi:hypothetical protein